MNVEKLRERDQKRKNRKKIEKERKKKRNKVSVCTHVVTNFPIAACHHQLPVDLVWSEGSEVVREVVREGVRE